MMAQRRAKAARAVARAVRLWILPPAHYWICFDCNKQAECYDHRDYRKPLDVWPVCNVCDAKRGAADPYDGGESYWNARRLATKKRLGIK